MSRRGIHPLLRDLIDPNEQQPNHTSQMTGLESAQGSVISVWRQRKPKPQILSFLVDRPSTVLIRKSGIIFLLNVWGTAAAFGCVREAAIGASAADHKSVEALDAIEGVATNSIF